MVTARVTVLRQLLKTVMLKEKVLPLMLNDVVAQTLEMEISCSASCRAVRQQLVRKPWLQKCLWKLEHLYTCCLVLWFPLWANKKENKKVSKIDSSAFPSSWESQIIFSEFQDTWGEQ